MGQCSSSTSGKVENYISEHKRSGSNSVNSSDNIRRIKSIKSDNLVDVELRDSTYESLPPYSLDGLKGWCKVVRVYDGDTLHVGFRINGSLYRIKCRLQGIDTAELKSYDDLEIRVARLTKRYVESITTDKLMWLVIHENDKYGGRYVASIYSDQTENPNTSISNLLLKAGLAYRYDGKTKKVQFNNWYQEDKGTPV